MTLPNFNNGQVFTNHPNDKNFAYAGDIPLVYIGASKTVYPEQTELDTRCIVQMLITGSDDKNVLQDFVDLRPVNGVFAKVKDLKEPRKFQKEPLRNGCREIINYDYKYDGSPVTGVFLYGEDPRIKTYGDAPQATNDPLYFNLTNYTRKTQTTFTAVKRNVVRGSKNIYRINFYYGILDPLDEPEDTGELAGLPFSFSPTYNKIEKVYMYGWYVRVLQDGFNQFVTKAEFDSLVYG